MKITGLSLGILVLLPTLVLAGPNAGGVLFLDADTTAVADSSYCGVAPLATCSLSVVTLPMWNPTNTVFRVWAAFPPDSSPRLVGLTFGISYDPVKFVLSGYGTCGDFELVGPGWPGSGSGTSMLWDTAQTSNLVEAYWFQGYAYSYVDGDTTSLALIPHPDQGGYFADDNKPSALDPIAAYGAIGFRTVGKLPCPTDQGGQNGVQWIGQNGDQSENGGGTPPDSSGDGGGGGGEPDSSGGGGGGGAEPDTLPNQVNALTVWIDSDAISINHSTRAPVPIGQVQFLNQTIPAVLARHGATTLAVEFPGTQGDTLETIRDGEQIRLPDISGYCVIEFPSAAAASGAISDLMGAPGVRIAQRIFKQPIATHDVCRSNDPYCHQFGDTLEPCFIDTARYRYYDVQWHLFNTGARGARNGCDSSVANMDLRLPADWPHGGSGPGEPPCDDPPCPPPPPHPGQVYLADVDLGVSSLHPDLSVVPCPNCPYRLHPDDDWCGDHGTAMAGLMGALTDNNRGVAGVCPSANIVDVEAASSCDQHANSMDPSWWSTMVEKADSMFVLQGLALRAQNLPFGAPSECDSPCPLDSVYCTKQQTEVLWRAFKRGIVSVAAHGDQDHQHPQMVCPASVPFVCGVGGFTQDGRYWSEATNCFDPTPQNCSGTSQGGTTPGWGLDVCAPASPGEVTTTVLRPAGSSYFWTSGQNSGASAMVTGAIGLLYRRWASLYPFEGLEPLADDYVGMLTATATPWDDPLVSYARCPTCTADDFGHGRINIAAACALVDSCYQGWTRPYLLSVAVGSGSGAVIDSTTLKWTVGGHTYRVYTVRKSVRIHEAGFDPAMFPRFIAWPVRWKSLFSSDTTNSCLVYGDPRTQDGVAQIVQLASEGLTDCEMGNIDQSTGYVTLTGHNIGEFWTDQNGHLQLMKYLVPWSKFRMYYAVVTEFGPAGVSTPRPGRPGSSAWLTGLSNPVQLPFSFQLHTAVAGHVTVEILDVTGRRAATLFDADVVAGTRGVAWTNTGGARFASGVYWIRLRFGRQETTKKMVVLR